MESGVGGKMSAPSNSSLLVELLSRVFDSRDMVVLPFLHFSSRSRPWQNVSEQTGEA